MARYEYRLRWRRVGRSPSSKIMQTFGSAVGKGNRLLALDRDKRVVIDGLGPSPFADMPDLEALTLERREVGEWEPDPIHTFTVPPPEPTADLQRRLAGRPPLPPPPDGIPF